MPPRRKEHTRACEAEQGNRDASATNAATPSRSRQRRARCLSRHGRHRCRLCRCCHWCCGQTFKHNCRHEGRQVWPRWGLVALPVARRAPGSRLNRTSGSTRGNGETIGHPPCAAPHGRRRRWWCPRPPLPTPGPWVRPQPPQAHAASCLALQRSRTPRYWIRGQGEPHDLPAAPQARPLRQIAMRTRRDAALQRSQRRSQVRRVPKPVVLTPRRPCRLAQEQPSGGKSPRLATGQPRTPL